MTLRVLGISGSLRRDSYNTALLRAAAELMPPGMELTGIARLDDIPLYNDDLWRAGATPRAVRDFRTQIASADALLFAVPEYNHSIPGVLKNALDWASRPPEQPFVGKPGAILGAATGRLGTVRAQEHLRQILNALDMRLLNKPEVFVGDARQKFNAEGVLVDEDTRQWVARLLVALHAWTLQITAPHVDLPAAASV